MKKNFTLEDGMSKKIGSMQIVGTQPKYLPYVTMEIKGMGTNVFIPDKDLETFAVNILKAIKSKKLK